MSIFGSIMSKVFGAGTANASPAGTGTMVDAPTAVPMSEVPLSSGEASAGVAQAVPGAASVAGQPVDVGALLSGLAAKSGQPSNWQTSIVDMMKLLGLDSSLESRKQLAQELHYSGDMNDSATMNIWLHQQVMRKLEENGGKLPDALKG
jgi:hypothetical protein